MLLLPCRAALLAKQLEANSRQAARRSQLRKVAKRERLQQPKLLIGKKKVYVCCGGVCEAGECFIHGLCRDPRPVLDVALSEELAHSRGSLRKAKARNVVVRCSMHGSLSHACALAGASRSAPPPGKVCQLPA